MNYILQIGEGNFLRAFVEDYANNLCDYKVVICQPRKNTTVINDLKKQNCKYDIVKRGYLNSKIIDERIPVNCVDCVYDTVTQYSEIVSMFCSEQTKIVVSNTTEAGIVYNSNDKYNSFPNCSYPAKLTYLLYNRYKSNISPIVILPCELIEDNGNKLKECVVGYSKLWQLENEFVDYVNKCAFCNTLVDRIVTGKVSDDLNCCSVACEPYKSWVVSAPDWAKSVIPFNDIEYVDDIGIYRQRKVKVLNGLHTMFTLAAYMDGFDIVRNVVNDVLYNDFINKACDEIKSTINLECDEYINSVLERFKNPFIDHKLYDISLNSISKFKVRCLVTIVDYYKLNNRLPKCLVFSLSALIAYYLKVSDRVYEIRDNEEVLEFFERKPNVNEILSNTDFWGIDLTQITNLENIVQMQFENIKSKGINCALKEAIYE